FEELAARLHEHPGQPLDWPGVGLREAAVMVPLSWSAGTPSVLFTRRPKTMRRHGGQISFPGVVLRPNPSEIAEVLEVPLWALLQPSRQRVERHSIRGVERDVFFFEYDG